MTASAERLVRRPGAFAIACAQRLLTQRHRRELYEQLALAAEAGMREAEAVHFIWRVRTHDGRRGKLHPLTLFCRDAAFSLNQEGRSLPDIALRWSGDIERPLLVAAVSRGGTAGMYRDLAEQMRSAMALRGALGTVLANAALLVLVAAGIGAFLAFYFFPAIEDFVDNEQLRGSAKSLFLAAIAFRDYWPFMAAGIVGVTAGAAAALPRLTGPVRDLLDGIEPFRTYRMLAGGVFLAGAAVLLRSGINERQALALLRHHANPYLAEHIRRLERIDAPFGERLNRVEGIWPDHRVKIEALFAASAADPIEEYARIGAALVQRTVKDCARLSSASAWITSFLLVAAIIWILLATNEFSASLQGG